jgi:hypothetical protein
MMAASATRDELTGDVPRSSVRALLASLVDYAGLFPPAKLDMATTVANYGDYLGSEDAWMLERLIVPAGRLDEFEACAAGRLPGEEDDAVWPLSVLVAPAGSPTLGDDLGRVARFNEAHLDPENGLAVIDVVEMKADEADAIDAALDAIGDDLFPYFELPVADDPRGLVAALAGSEAGAKIRTGGVTPDLYPSPDEVARFLAACAAADVPFKATAGLHHPITGHRDVAGATGFGFLNVFVAAVIARFGRADVSRLREVLTDESAGNFTFDDDGLAWREHRFRTGQVEETRLSFAASFGSCSFDEPRDDLRAMGLL